MRRKDEEKGGRRKGERQRGRGEAKQWKEGEASDKGGRERQRMS